MADVDLQVAVMVGDRRDVKRYINAGGDLEVKDEDGATALFHAAFWTHVDVAKDLIDAGADLNAHRNDGFTPLHVAVKNNQPRMTDVLVKAMADLSAKEEFGDTPLHWAYRSKATECIDILLAAGADTEVHNAMGKTPMQCEGTGVDRQMEDDDIDDDDIDEGRPQVNSDAPSVGEASTVVGDPGSREAFSGKSPNRPSDGRSAGARTSPRTSRNRSGASSSGGQDPEELRRANFRISHPPRIQAGGKLFRRRVLYALSQWHSITAYLFEPSAYRTVRQAHHARLGGDRRPFASENQVDDGDRAIPPGTDIVVRPRFSRTCCVNPSQATVSWMKDIHAVSFEVRPPASASSGTVTGCVEFYIGAMLLGEAHVDMAVVKTSQSVDEPDVLGPVGKAFDSAYVCIAPADEVLVLPSLQRFNRLGIAKLSWSLTEAGEKEIKNLIREASVFQICWSSAAQASSRVKNELKYAASLAKTGSLAVRGIFWDPAADVTSVKAEGGLAFPVRLHNTFLLEKPCVILGWTPSEISSLPARSTNATTTPLRDSDASCLNKSQPTSLGGTWKGTDKNEIGGGIGVAVPPVEKLCTRVVEQTRGHILRLREMVGGADTVDIPRIAWIYPEDGDLKTDTWLKKPLRCTFLCPITMKPGRCGEDGKGYKLSLPRGWGGKIGIAVKIGVLCVAAASDTGEVPALPVPRQPLDDASRSGQDTSSALSSVEWQGEVVNAVYDAVAGAVDSKSSDLVDSAFVDAENEASSRQPLSESVSKQSKTSYANLRSLIQKFDKGLKLTGLQKVTYQKGITEWVHPCVAELFRREGPTVFRSDALIAADEAAVAAAAREAREREKGATSGGSDVGGEERRPKDNEVMHTLRLLENQILAMVARGGGSGA